MSQVLLATAGYDHTIKFWEAPSGLCQKTLQHPESQVNKLEITPDKQRIAAAGNPSLRLFDIVTGAATSYDGHTNNVTAVGFQKVRLRSAGTTPHARSRPMRSERGAEALASRLKRARSP
jgi:WD40 repeat protein